MKVLRKCTDNESMIQVTNTENLAGVTISGDFYDLDNLVNALHEITVSDMDENIDKVSSPYVNISIRVLGVCYDIRHAGQGDREIYTEDNGIEDFHMEAHQKIVPRQNVYYSCNILYPEMIVVMMALNELVQLRIQMLAGSKYKFDAAFDKAVVWDRTISVIRVFQSEFQKAVSDALSNASFARWQNLVNKRFIEIRSITSPFIDTWNLQYLDMTKETRLKKLLTVTKRFAEHYRDPENLGYRKSIDEALEIHGVSESDLRFEGLDFPETIDW